MDASAEHNEKIETNLDRLHGQCDPGSASHSIVSCVFVVQFLRKGKSSEIHLPHFDRPMGWPTSKCHVKSTKQSKAQQETKTEGKLCISGPVGSDCTLLHSTAVPLSAGRSACCSLCCRAAPHCSFCSISRPAQFLAPDPS